jgi:hypothetical protein
MLFRLFREIDFDESVGHVSLRNTLTLRGKWWGIDAMSDVDIRKALSAVPRKWQEHGSCHAADCGFDALIYGEIRALQIIATVLVRRCAICDGIVR